MTEYRQHKLVISSNHGRYALDDADNGPDLTSGQSLEILLGGHWISGRVEHGQSYANRSLQYIGDPGPDTREVEGYYFIADTGELCGLCTGMVVRIPSRY